MFNLVLPRNGLSTTSRRPLDSFARQLLEWDGQAATQEFAPRADILETREQIVVRLEMAGLNAADIDVNLEKDVLTVKAERKPPERTDGELYHRSELVYGVFSRAFTLPGTVSRDGIEARYEGGILTVTIPRAEESKPRVIEVKST